MLLIDVSVDLMICRSNKCKHKMLPVGAKQQGREPKGVTTNSLRDSMVFCQVELILHLQQNVSADNPSEGRWQIHKAFNHTNCGHTQLWTFLGCERSLTRYTLLEGTSQRMPSVPTGMTRHLSPHHSFSDSWRSETFNISSATAPSLALFSQQQNHFSLFISTALRKQPAGSRDRTLPN